eukprot:m.15717 g.15717  ORF g.15717 m.15717 type:complete len:356 (+) comp5474_c0_seq2:44-1111(+)
MGFPFLLLVLAIFIDKFHCETIIESCTSQGTMEAIRVKSFGEPEVLTVDTVPIPSPVAGDDVVVKVIAAGVNPVDTYIRAGAYARKPELPYTPGADGGGEVHSVGADVKDFKPGDRVYITASKSGTYAQYSLCSASGIQKLPDNVTYEQGAALNVAYRTAYRALVVRARVQQGQTVLVHGASGGVGLAGVQLAKAHKCKVIGTAGTADGIELLKTQGCDFVFNHRDENYVEEIVKATEGKGVDIILEMLANVNLAKDLELLGHGGCVAVIGNRGNVEINPRLLMQKEASVVGVMGGTPEEIAAAFTAINTGLTDGSLSPVISSPVYTLKDVPAAHVDVIARKKCSPGKIIIKPWD